MRCCSSILANCFFFEQIKRIQETPIAEDKSEGWLERKVAYQNSGANLEQFGRMNDVFRIKEIFGCSYQEALLIDWEEYIVATYLEANKKLFMDAYNNLMKNKK